MKRLAVLANPYWATGVVLAGVGVLVARAGGTAFAPEWQPIGTSVGRLLAFSGLGLIAWGIRCRARGDPPG